MALLGTFAYQTTARLLAQISERQLNALAESRKDDLQNVFQSWKDKVSLVRSRTQLRINLARFVDSGDRSDLGGVDRILTDALHSVAVFKRITIYSLDEQAIVAVGESPVAVPFVMPVGDGVQLAGSFPMADGTTQIALRSMLNFEGRRIGGVEVVLQADDLRSVAGDYTGLGKTGETLIVLSEDDTWARVIHPLRHIEKDYTRVRLDEASAGIRAALSGTGGQGVQTYADYRGEIVWAATRHIDGLGWGLVVKIDAAEEEQLSDELQTSLIDLSLALSAFAVVGGTFLGFWLARPVLRLREVVHQVRQGNTHIRADTTGDDEIAYLARALNDFLDDYLEEHAESEAAGSDRQDPQ